MALSGNFSLQDVYDEFHPLYAQKGMRWMYERIIGTPSSGGKLSDFSGYGSPSVTRTGDSADPESITVNIDVTTNGTTTYVRLQANPDYDPSIIETGSWVSKSNGSTTVTLSGLEDDTTYSYRIQYYNSFGTSTYYEQSSAYSQATQQGTLDAPSIRNTISYSALNGYDIEWDTTGPEPTGFSIEYRVNGGSWSGVNNITNKVNWGSGTDPKSADIVTGQLPNPFDFFEFRMRATRSGYTTSAYSNIRGYQH